ncbi:ATP-binding domain-containing protein [soil metagenome]
MKPNLTTAPANSTEKKKSILDFLEFSSPTEEQEKALLSMANFVSKDNLEDFLILSGAAGTGKTSITTTLIQYLNSKDTNYKIAAPTGRAARILGKKSRTTSSTIHSLIYNSVANPNTGEVVFKLKPNIVKDLTVYILDEASMISTIVTRDEASLFVSTNSLLNDLVKFIKDGNLLNKMILLGDKNQLPPIQEDFSKALSREYLIRTYGLEGSAHQLTEVKRQQKDSYILKNAVTLRESIDNEMPAEELTDIERQPMKIAALNYISEYKKYGYENSISIAASHNMNRVFNEMVRTYLFGRNIPQIVKKDLLLITQTWRRGVKELYSGDHVVIIEVDLDATEFVAGLRFVPVKLKYKNIKDQDEFIDDVLILECITHPKGLKAEQERRLRSERFRANKKYQKSGAPWDDKYVGAIRATYGYSITCHKAQGGEWKKVYINEFYMPTLRYQYTAITRAKEELVLY